MSTLQRSAAAGPVEFLLIQQVVPDYRIPLFDLLAKRWGSGFAVLSGDVGLDATVRTPAQAPPYVQRISNRFYLRRQLTWQRGVLMRAIRADVVVVELNPRILSVWAILLLRGVRRRPTVAWGHAWPRLGPSARSDALRNLMRHLATTVVCYTDSERDALRRRMPSKRVLSAPNALYHESAIRATCHGPVTDFLFAGRLVPTKKPRLLLAAYAEAAALGLPERFGVAFAGDGPEMTELVALLARLPRLRERVRFLGHVPPDQISAVYARSVASVSPGYAGLSLTQSLSLGVPMIIARDEPHSPEIEAAVDGVNAIFVASDDAAALAQALLRVAEEREAWVARRSVIAAACAGRYSLERTASGLIDAVQPAMACGTRAAAGR